MRLIHFMPSLALIVLAAVCPKEANGKSVVVNGVTYSCNSANMHAQAKGWSAKYTGSKAKLTIVDRVQDGGDFYTVTSIANQAFQGEKGTTTVVIGSTVETIGTQAFCESGVKKVSLPFNLRIIGEAAFYNTALVSVELPARLQILRKNAFGCNKNLTTVTGGANITEIGERAFWSCGKLKAFNMGAQVISLGREAFQDCVSMTGLTLSSSLTVIPEDAFNRCPIANLRFPSSVTTIGAGAFYCCATPNLIIPGTVKTIGESAFEHNSCSSLSLGEGITTIGWMAFYNCESLQSVQLPRSAVNVGEKAFANCYKLATVKLAPTLTQIPRQMFYESGVKSVEIPEGVVTVGGWAFYSCPNLDGVNLPSTIKIVEDHAFCNSPLKSLVMKEGVTEIGDRAFNELECEELVIPASVTTIGMGAFGGSFIKRVKSLSETPATCGENAFGAITTRWWLEVPEGTRELYEGAPVWKEFQNIKEVSDAATGEIPADTSTEIIATRWYSIDGAEVSTPLPGHLYLRVSLKADGSTTSEKILKR